MITSMTAFARCQKAGAWGQLNWEIRSVNHRYLEIGMRLPDPLRQLEGPVRTRIGEVLSRGKVDCALRFRVDYHNPESMVVNEEIVDRLTDLARRIEIKIHESSSLSVADLLNWPGVITEEGIDYEAVAHEAMAALDEALDELVAGRRREGEHLAGVIRERLDLIGEQIKQVRAVLPELLPNYRERLEARLAEIKDSVDPTRLEQEIVLFANRVDVAEELDRLEAHLREVGNSLAGNQPVGRRLDFLMQEMNREANTLGSKAADIRLTNASVELKVLIEQIREQVQNIE